MRPDPASEFNIVRATDVSTRQHNEQWRAVGAAVVAIKRNFTQAGHFSPAHFVQNLSGFGVALGDNFRRLRLRQVTQYAARDPGENPQELP